MKRNHNSSPKVFSNKQDESTHFQGQMKKVFAAFYKQPKTMLTVSIETGILRANICRYVAKWRKRNCIRVEKYGICPISKHRAGYYTTNPENFPAIVELSNTVKP